MAAVFKYYRLMYPDPSARVSDADCRTAIVSYARNLKARTQIENDFQLELIFKENLVFVTSQNRHYLSKQDSKGIAKQKEKKIKESFGNIWAKKQGRMQQKVTRKVYGKKGNKIQQSDAHK